MRFGLVGTGHWAQITHAPALASADGTELVAVWGRDAGRAESLAREHGADAHTDYEAFLRAVDAVAFSVPPNVQAELAIRAAEAGKHLLLEKPIALEAAQAQALAASAERASVASVVFFTQLYRQPIRDWLRSGGPDGWEGGRVRLLGSVEREPSPFRTPWRLEHGALWDLGPHAVSALIVAFGQVADVQAHRDARGTVHMILQHESGLSSTAAVSQRAASSAGGFGIELWNGAGISVAPIDTQSTVAVLGGAVAELIASSSGSGHPFDAAFGSHVVQVLTRAQDAIGAGR